MTEKPGQKKIKDRLLVWSRVLAKRRRDCAKLPKDDLECLLSHLLKMSAGVKVPAVHTNSFDKMEFLLTYHMKLAGNGVQVASRRRQALHVVTTLLSMINAASEKYDKQQQTAAERQSAPTLGVVDADKESSENAATAPVSSNKENQHQSQPLQKSTSSSLPASQQDSSRNTTTTTTTGGSSFQVATSTAVSLHKQSSVRNTNKSATAAPNHEKQQTLEAPAAAAVNSNNSKNTSVGSRWGPPASQQPQQREVSAPEQAAPAARPTTANNERSIGGSTTGTQQLQQPQHPLQQQQPRSAPAPPRAPHIQKQLLMQQYSSTAKEKQLKPYTDMLPAVAATKPRQPDPTETRNKEIAAANKEEQRRTLINHVLKAATLSDPRGRGSEMLISGETIPSRKGSGPHSVYSGSLFARPQIAVQFKPEKLDEKQAEDLVSRLERWDPFWIVTKYIACGRTSLSRSTVKAAETPKMVARWAGKVDAAGITDWGKIVPEYRIEQVRLILRMIPVNHKKKKSADGHKWPLGCFLTIHNKPIELALRKQQEHNKEEWKGICKFLDVTPHIVNPLVETEFKICTYDDEPYYFCLAACKYRSPASLFVKLLESSTVVDPALKVLSREQAIEKALTFAKPVTFTLESDDDGGVEESVGKFVFTLTDAYSGGIIQNPVRGRCCPHFQCFDLKNWLTVNGTESGGRWRCGSCEKWLSFQDLELCEFTADLIVEMKDQLKPTQRDRVLFSSDKSYELLAERKQRYGGKKRSRPESNEANPNSVKKAPSAVQEIILLDD